MLLAENELLRQVRSLAGPQTGALNVALGLRHVLGLRAAGRLLARSPKLVLSLHWPAGAR